MWQVIKDGKVIKEFPHPMQCYIYCAENGWMLTSHADFHGDKTYKNLAKGIEIKESNEAQLKDLEGR